MTMKRKLKSKDIKQLYCCEDDPDSESDANSNSDESESESGSESESESESLTSDQKFLLLVVGLIILLAIYKILSDVLMFLITIGPLTTPSFPTPTQHTQNPTQ